jgi:transcriptional accessory protein Tex/SPT6
MYYNFEETVPKIPSHRMLAIRRGTRGAFSITRLTSIPKINANLVPQVIRDGQSVCTSP